jgi:phosphatidylglycerol lysyltransferase
LLRRHGRATTSFQTLGPEFEYFFDGDDAFVGYKDTGAAWVAAGDPVASAERTGEVVAHFVQRARARGRRAVFFCVTPELVDGDALTGLPIGEDPVWSPGAWPETLAGARRLGVGRTKAISRVRPLTRHPRFCQRNLEMAVLLQFRNVGSIGAIRG